MQCCTRRHRPRLGGVVSGRLVCDDWAKWSWRFPFLDACTWLWLINLCKWGQLIELQTVIQRAWLYIIHKMTARLVMTLLHSMCLETQSMVCLMRKEKTKHFMWSNDVTQSAISYSGNFAWLLRQQSYSTSIWVWASSGWEAFFFFFFKGTTHPWGVLAWCVNVRGSLTLEFTSKLCFHVHSLSSINTTNEQKLQSCFIFKSCEELAKWLIITFGHHYVRSQHTVIQ